jgi:hypothetical protein
VLEIKLHTIQVHVEIIKSLIEWDLVAMDISAFKSHATASGYRTLASCIEMILQLSTLQTEIECGRHSYSSSLLRAVAAGNPPASSLIATK